MELIFTQGCIGKGDAGESHIPIRKDSGYSDFRCREKQEYSQTPKPLGAPRCVGLCVITIRIGRLITMYTVHGFERIPTISCFSVRGRDSRDESRSSERSFFLFSTLCPTRALSVEGFPCQL